VLLIPVAGVLKDVPLATLAAVLIFIALRLFHVHDLMAIARFSRIEFGLAAITLLAVVFIGVEQGIAAAVILAILDRIRLTARPQLHVLGRVPGSTSWTPLSANAAAMQQPGVLAVLFPTPIWYANAEHFREQVAAALERNGPTQVLVLDALGMTDIDYTGSQELERAVDALDRVHIRFGIARAGGHARESLRRSGLEARIGSDHFYSTVDEAVTALSAGPASAA